jgi:hypothetical protein
MLAAVKRPPLPRWRADWPHAWLAPVLAAACWALALGSSTEAATQRSLVFIGGPLVLLAGLHARLTEYLHGRARERLAPLPIVAGGTSRRRSGCTCAGWGWRSCAGVAGVLLGPGQRGARGCGRRCWRVILCGWGCWRC